jgi:hypothetical protein
MVLTKCFLRDVQFTVENIMYMKPELKKNDEPTNTLQGGRSILGSFAKPRKVTFSFVKSVSLPVRTEQLGSTEHIFMKYDVFRYPVEWSLRWRSG